jgi:hypothetical protein
MTTATTINNILNVTTYEIVNIKTGAVVTTSTCMNRARNMVDKRDNAYGSYVHMIRTVTK